MALHFIPALLFLFFLLLLFPAESQKTLDPHLIDNTIKDFVLQSFSDHRKTAVLYNLSLPANLSGVTVDAVRYRSSGLWFRGARIKEFNIQPYGANILHGTKRLIIVRQNLGNLTTAYVSYGNLSGLQFVSPVLGLLIYRFPQLAIDETHDRRRDIVVMGKPVLVNFSRYFIGNLSTPLVPLCALFELDGTVSLSNASARYVCEAWRQGHYALVIEGNKKECGSGGEWKVILVSALAGVFGAVLMALLVMAMINVRRRRAEVAEMERRAYENEALRMSMVGHIRAPVAAEIRTAPDNIIDDD